MSRLRGLLVIAAFAAPAPAGVQDCTIDPPSAPLTPVSSTGSYGASVAVDGDWIAVGAPALSGDAAGRVELFERRSGAWSHHSVIVPSDGARGDRFGKSVALRGDTLLVGASSATGTAENTGAGYVFRLTGGLWLEEAKLGAPDGQPADAMGFGPIGLDGDVAVLGALGHDALGVNSGAVYVYERTGAAWSFVQKLLAPDGAAGDWFGATVAIDAGFIAVSAPSDDVDGGSNRGSVRLFARSAGAWAQRDMLSHPDTDILAFGRHLQLRGGVLLATFRYPPLGTKPVALVYELDDQGWGLPRLVSSAGGAGEANLEQAIVALAPDGLSALWATSTGLGINVLWRDGGEWHTDRTVWAADPAGGPSSVAFDGESMVAARVGKAFVASVPPRDRDGDGFDDACEIASGEAEDCDEDGLIDDAQRPYRFTVDRSAPKEFWSSALADLQVMVLNRFRTTVDGEMLTSVSWLRPPFEGAPISSATVVVYSDPDGDGNPVDGVLLHAQPVELDGKKALLWVTVSIDPVALGPSGTPFFVGLVFPPGTTEPHVASESEVPHRQASWWVSAVGSLDLEDLTLNPPIPWEQATHGVLSLSYSASVIALRANFSDCNANTRLDSCEIADGDLPDADGDGVPDDCFPPASEADLNGDMVVDAADLGLLLSAWGRCAAEPAPCDADLDGDGVVSGTDLGVLLSMWSE